MGKCRCLSEIARCLAANLATVRTSEAGWKAHPHTVCAAHTAHTSSAHCIDAIGAERRRGTRGTHHALVEALVEPARSSITPAVASIGKHGRWPSTSRHRGVRTKHCDTLAILGTTERDHVLANMGGDDLTTLGISVGEDMLNEVVAVLIAGDVDERHTRTVDAGLADGGEVAIHELGAGSLQTLLNHLGCELIRAVLGRETENVFECAGTVWVRAVLADVLDAPVAELAMRDHINAAKDLTDTGALVLLQAVLEDVLDDKAAGLAKCHLMPHATESFVDVAHNLWWLVAPAQLEQLLPDVASVAMDHRLGDAAQKLVYHDGLVLLRHIVEGLLDDMTPEGIHAEVEGVATDGTRNGDDLFRCTVFEAALDKKVAEAINAERVCLFDD